MSILNLMLNFGTMNNYFGGRSGCVQPQYQWPIVYQQPSFLPYTPPMLNPHALMASLIGLFSSGRQQQWCMPSLPHLPYQPMGTPMGSYGNCFPSGRGGSFSISDRPAFDPFRHCSSDRRPNLYWKDVKEMDWGDTDPFEDYTCPPQTPKCPPPVVSGPCPPLVQPDTYATPDPVKPSCPDPVKPDYIAPTNNTPTTTPTSPTKPETPTAPVEPPKKQDNYIYLDVKNGCVTSDKYYFYDTNTKRFMSSNDLGNSSYKNDNDEDVFYGEDGFFSPEEFAQAGIILVDKSGKEYKPIADLNLSKGGVYNTVEQSFDQYSDGSYEAGMPQFSLGPNNPISVEELRERLGVDDLEEVTLDEATMGDLNLYINGQNWHTAGYLELILGQEEDHTQVAQKGPAGGGNESCFPPLNYLLAKKYAVGCYGPLSGITMGLDLNPSDWMTNKKNKYHQLY